MNVTRNSVLHEAFTVLPKTNDSGFSHQQFSVRAFLHVIKGDGAKGWDWICGQYDRLEYVELSSQLLLQVYVGSPREEDTSTRTVVFDRKPPELVWEYLEDHEAYVE